MEYLNTERLAGWLRDCGHAELAEQKSFMISEGEHALAVKMLHGRIHHEHLEDRAAFRCITAHILPAQKIAASEAIKLSVPDSSQAIIAALQQQTAENQRQHRNRFIIAIILAVIAILAFSVKGHSEPQQNPSISRTTTACGTLPSGMVVTPGNPAPVLTDESGNLCAGVTVTASVSTPGLAVSVNSGSSSPNVNPTGGNVESSPPSYSTNGVIEPLSLDANGNLRVVGNFVVTQCTSSTCTSTVVQPTAANLNATVVGTGTFAVQAGQTGTWTIQPGNTPNTTPWLATINQGGNSATVTAGNALKVDGSGVTQPVSGTFYQTTQPVSCTTANCIIEIGNGATVAAVKAASTAPVAGDPALVVAISPNTPSLGVTVGNQCTSSTCTDTVVQPTGSNLHVDVDSAPTTAVTIGSPVATTCTSSTCTDTVVQPTAANLNVTVGNAIGNPVYTTACSAGTCAGVTGGGLNTYQSPYPGGGVSASGAVTSAMTGTTSTSVIAAVTGSYLYIQSCTVSNASLTVSTDIVLQIGSGGTTIATIPAPAAAVATTGGGGATVNFGPGGLKVSTISTALYAANVTTGSSTKISCNGYSSTVSW